MRIRHNFQNILASIYQKRHAFLKAVFLKIGIPQVILISMVTILSILFVSIFMNVFEQYCAV